MGNGMTKENSRSVSMLRAAFVYERLWIVFTSQHVASTVGSQRTLMFEHWKSTVCRFVRTLES